MRFGAAGQDKGPNPYRGIIWAAIFLGVLLVITHWARKPAGPAEPSPKDVAAKAEDERPAGREKGRAMVGAVHEPDPTEADKKRVPAYLTAADMVVPPKKSERLALHAYYWLLNQLKDADVGAVEGAAKPLTSPRQVDDLAAGTWVRFEGTVFTVGFRDNDQSVRHVLGPSVPRYEMIDANGNLYLVYAAHRVRGVTEDDEATVVGRFLQLRPHVRSDADPDAKAVDTPVIIAKQLDGSRYLEDASVLEGVADRRHGEEAKPLYYLANRVRGLSQAELKERAEPVLTAEEIERAPASARGRFVAVEGALANTQLLAQPPNIAGIERFYRCIIRTRGGQRFWIYTLEDPQGFVKNDVVKGYGVFFKAVRYTSRGKYEPVAHVVIARRLVRVKYERPTHLAVTLAVLGALTLIALLIGLHFERRKSAEVGGRMHALSAKSRPADLNAAARRAAGGAEESDTEVE